MIRESLLTAAVFLPAAAALVAAVGRREWLARWASILASGLVFGLLLGAYLQYRKGGADGFQFVQEVSWIPAWGIHYRVGADGVSLALGVMAAGLAALVFLYSWESIKERVVAYHVCFLLLESGMLGVFFSLDLFQFYVFWEISLIPMYLIVGMWGGPRRIYAAMKFVLFTVLGSLLMLVAILWLFARYGESLDLRSLPRTAGVLPFLAFALAFVVKVPLWPFHTWLPDAHVEAPTGGSVILAGVLLKLGVYGLYRLAIPLFPDAAREWASVFLVLAVVSAIYGALMSMVQTDIKKMIAYSSVSHMGFVVLGLFAFSAEAAQGAILQSVNNGISTGALFFLVGVLYERTHTRGVDDFGGLAKVTPAFAAVFLLITLSSIGLPGLNGFVGEFLILAGAFRALAEYRFLVAAAGTVVILGAMYMLSLYRGVFFGRPRTSRWGKLPDLTTMEWGALLPLVAAAILLGVLPGWVLANLQGPVADWLALVRP